MRRLSVMLSVLIIALIIISGFLLTEVSRAEEVPAWLPFDGKTVSVEPTLLLLNAGPEGISLHASLPGAYAETVYAEGSFYTRLSGNGYAFPPTYGLPSLPVLREVVEIPFGAQVSIEILSAIHIDVPLDALGLHPIYPLQPPVPKHDSAQEDQPFIIDDKFYMHGSLYPSAVVSLGEPYIVRGHRLLPVEVWPVGYDPSRARLRLYSQVSFRLNFNGSDMPTTTWLAQRYASPSFDALISDRVLNYNQGRQSGVDSQIGYLIISADAYADAMAPFVALQEARGFVVSFVRQSDIPNGNLNTGIKAYIQAAYDSWPLPPSYVLLVGDTDTIPYWYGPVTQYPTDLYFATMDGPDDWHPDLARGRFPVRSAEQAALMVEKYLAYANLTGDEPWLKTVSLPATCDEFFYANIEDSHNYVIDNYTAPGGFTGNFPDPLIPGGDRLYCITHQATHSDMIEQFNHGRWAIIYSGHGAPYQWEMGFVPGDIRNLTNDGMYPIVFAFACETALFTTPESIGETWVLQQGKGALAYLGSSTLSMVAQDDIFEQGIFDAFFVEETPHTDMAAMTDAGLAFVEQMTPDTGHYYWETYNILGDPSVRLFMEKEIPHFTLNLTPTRLGVCTQGTSTSLVTVDSFMGYNATVNLESGTLPVNVSATFDPQSSTAPFTSTLALDVSPGAEAGDYTLTITATDQTNLTRDAEASLLINFQAPITPTLLNPPDGSINQLTSPSFTWAEQPLMHGYSFELSTLPTFETTVFSATDLSDPGVILNSDLADNTCYWWRTRAANACGSGPWAQPYRLSTPELVDLFFDDMESGEAFWSHRSDIGDDFWALSEGIYHSPTHVWYTYSLDNFTDTSLWITNPISLEQGSLLTFWHFHEFDGPNFDGAVLEISSDGGDTWIDLGPNIIYNGYNGIISDCCGNPLAGRPAWVGDVYVPKRVTVDLDEFAGQQALIRWRFAADNTRVSMGWAIDDVRITAPLSPNTAPALVSITPSQGNNYLPTDVLITGANFIANPILQLGTALLQSVTQVDTGTITAVVPAGLPIGVYDLVLFNSDCQSAYLPAAFTVYQGDQPIEGLEATNSSPTYLGDTTAFTATIQQGENVIFTWDFDDGATGNGAALSHQYQSEGIYLATVTSINSTNSLTATTQVTVIASPLKSFFLPLTMR